MPAKIKGQPVKNLPKIDWKSQQNTTILQPRFEIDFFMILLTFWRPKSTPNHPNPFKMLLKSSQNDPQILPKWSRKPPEHPEERQIAATKASQTPKLLATCQAIRSLLGSNWAPKSMKNRTKINVKKNMFCRLIFSWFGPHFGGVF